MSLGVLLLNFGEPEQPVLEEVVPFLERIFTTNASLMGRATPDQVRARSRELAEARAPGLIEEYIEIGGSPLARQAREQGEALDAELRRRGRDALVLVGYQFTAPSIADVVEEARRHDVDALVALPVYPLAGPSTTVAALADVDRELERLDWRPALHRFGGWHRHPAYLALRADAVRRVLDAEGLSLADPETRLVFSAHGTPMKYLAEGSRYDRYVREFCAEIARRLAAPGYELGYQNHSNRPGVEWTQPDIGEVIRTVEARRVVVDPVSFMHEQSETLAELDHELREEAEARGLDFYRVPIAHAAPEFIGVLADLVEAVAPAAGGTPPHDVAGVPLRACACQPAGGTRCLNDGKGAPAR